MANQPTGNSDALLLPEGTRLVHIGPPKTGTSSLQGAFHACRPATEAQGVHYAGRRRHSGSAVQAVSGRPGFFTNGTPPPMSNWRELVSDARRSKARRVVISSEFFADVLPDTLPRIVDDLSGERVHVVVTLRPLAKIVPSQWQQYVQSGMRVPYERWLDAMLTATPGKLTPTFWRRHRHDELIARWADVVGPDRMTVIALDDRDHGMVLRVFEQLTGLHEGTLVAPPEVTNRSMTLPEIEAVRAFNAAFKAEDLGPALLSKVMHFGAATYMRQREPSPDEPRVETPQWALDRVRVISREIVDHIAASGVRVVGDLERLAAVQEHGLPDDPMPEVSVSPEIAASMAMGVLFSSGLARRPNPSSPVSKEKPDLSRLIPVFSEPLETVRLPTEQLVGIILRRGRVAVAWRWQRLIHRNGNGGRV